jgi:peptidylprolyl isomerase
MTQAKNGDTVKVHYTGKLDDGTEFDSSIGDDPLEFTIGTGQIIPGFEQAVIGLTPGDSKSATIPAEQAYGPHQEELVLVVGRDKFPPHIKPSVGQRLEMRQAEDRSVSVIVTDISASDVTLDANHPLAGEDLIFDIQLVEIV